jgi:type IV secretion system protein VirB4
VITWWDEFWRALLDPLCADMIQNALKTRRKLNSPVILATQSARDMLKAPISRSIIEQCATAFYTPNPRADYDDYVVGLKRSETEFRIISEDMVGQRKFLFTQGETSISCDLDLEDLPAYVAVLSGRRGTVKLAERLMQERGKAWLPEFMARWREAVE